MEDYLRVYYHISSWLLSVAPQSISYNALIRFMVPKPPSIIEISRWDRRGVQPKTFEIINQGPWCVCFDTCGSNASTEMHIMVDWSGYIIITICKVWLLLTQKSGKSVKLSHEMGDLSIPKVCCNVIRWMSKLECEYLMHFVWALSDNAMEGAKRVYMWWEDVETLEA